MRERVIKVQIADDYEGCNKCERSCDTEEICMLRGCIHAIGRIRECYSPKADKQKGKNNE